MNLGSDNMGVQVIYDPIHNINIPQSSVTCRGFLSDNNGRMRASACQTFEENARYESIPQCNGKIKVLEVVSERETPVFGNFELDDDLTIYATAIYISRLLRASFNVQVSEHIQGFEVTSVPSISLEDFITAKCM